MSRSNKSEWTADGTVPSTLLHRLGAGTSRRSKYLSLLADLGQRRVLKPRGTMRAGFAPAALPARAPHLSSLRHTGVPRGSHPGCPSCGPAAPPGRAPPCAPRHARPGSLSPESPPRPGTSAGCLFALRGRRPLGPRPACPERVDAAAWRALFGIVCAHLSAPGGPRASGQSAPRAGAHLADASSRLPARGPRRAGQGLRKGRAAGSWGGPFPGSPAPERRAEGRGPQVRGQGLGGCGYRREPRIKPELLGAVAQSPNLAAAEGACLLWETCPRASPILQSFRRCYSCCSAVFPGS